MERLRQTNNAPAAYVGTFKKYNEGSLFGKWLTLTNYQTYDKFIAACNELHKDEQEPELMIQDTENIPEGLSFGECPSRQDFNDIITVWSEEQEQANETNDQGERFTIVDYSDKALAVVGDTKAIKDELKALGGRFNPRLNCGPGWIFSKKVEKQLRELLKGSKIETGERMNDSKANNREAQYIANLEELKATGEYIPSYKNPIGAIKIQDKYIVLTNPKTETVFWYHDEGVGYDNYKIDTKTDERKKRAFLYQNLEGNHGNGTDPMFDLKKAERDLIKFGIICCKDRNAKEYPARAYIHDGEERGWYLDRIIIKLDEDEINEVMDGLKWSKAKMEKKLNTYLKRWGTSKLRFSTYWADR